MNFEHKSKSLTTNNNNNNNNIVIHHNNYNNNNNHARQGLLSNFYQRDDIAVMEEIEEATKLPTPNHLPSNSFPSPQQSSSPKLSTTQQQQQQQQQQQHVKGPWTAEEDNMLRTLVAKYGTKHWSIIA